MTKQDIIEYLDAVCDAESIVQVCNDAIVAYENQKKRINPIHFCETIKPTKRDIPYRKKGFFAGFHLALIIVFFFIYYIAFALIGSELLGLTNSELRAIMVAALGAAVVTVYLIHHVTEKKAYDAAKEKIEKEYDAAMKEYEAELIHRKEAYEKSSIIQRRLCDQLDEAIKNQINIRDKALEKLKALYTRDILYPTFHNLVAAFQIKEYLQMGLCDTLSGPNGAYAQYMQDVHTQQICESIDDLKKAVVNSIGSLQSALSRELKVIGNNLNNLTNSMDDNFGKLNSSISAMQWATAEQISGHFSEANKHLANIDQNIANAAHNTYIQQKFRNVDTYLLKAPVDPS